MYTFIFPLLYAPALPLIRIALRNRPHLRNRAYGVGIAVGLAHAGYTGADIAAVCREAALAAIEERADAGDHPRYGASKRDRCAEWRCRGDYRYISNDSDAISNATDARDSRAIAAAADSARGHKRAKRPWREAAAVGSEKGGEGAAHGRRRTTTAGLPPGRAFRERIC